MLNPWVVQTYQGRRISLSYVRNHTPDIVSDLSRAGAPSRGRRSFLTVPWKLTGCGLLFVRRQAHCSFTRKRPLDPQVQGTAACLSVPLSRRNGGPEEVASHSMDKGFLRTSLVLQSAPRASSVCHAGYYEDACSRLNKMQTFALRQGDPSRTCFLGQTATVRNPGAPGSGDVTGS